MGGEKRKEKRLGVHLFGAYVVCQEGKKKRGWVYSYFVGEERKGRREKAKGHPPEAGGEKKKKGEAAFIFLLGGREGRKKTSDVVFTLL